MASSFSCSFQHDLVGSSLEHLKSIEAFYEQPTAKPTRSSLAYRHLLAHYYNQLIPQNASVLEIGCGPGSLLELIQSSDKSGIDLCPSQLEAARKLLPEAHFELSAGELFQAERTYDVIIVSDTLNQAADCQLLLRQAASAAHENTRLIVNFYNGLWSPLLKLARHLKLAPAAPNSSWLSEQDVLNFLNLSGWELIRTTGKIVVPYPNCGLVRWLNRWLSPIFSWLTLTRFVVARYREFPTAAPVEKPNRSVSIIVPARNEAGNLEDAILRVPTMSPDQEWIFVEGGSKDNTWEVMQQLPAKFPDKKIRFFRQSASGKANAVWEGFAAASGEILMILDADLTMPPEELPKFYEAIMNGKAEFANGVRLVYPMDKKAMPFLNLCVNKFFAILFTWLLEQPVKDTLCGTKVLLKSNYLKIVALRKYFGDFDPFGDFELLFGASKLNLKIIDIPIRYKERSYGSTNISRWKHGAILLNMALFGATKLKFF